MRFESVLELVAQRSMAGKVADHQLQRTPAAALSLLRAIETDPATGTYRPGLLSSCKRSLRALRDVPEEGMADAITAVQTQVRAGVERPRSGPVVGSGLRLKGLEFDHVAIVDPECCSTPEEVYVAVSRARAFLHDCHHGGSPDAVVLPAPRDGVTQPLGIGRVSLGGRRAAGGEGTPVLAWL